MLFAGVQREILQMTHIGVSSLSESIGKSKDTHSDDGNTKTKKANEHEKGDSLETTKQTNEHEKGDSLETKSGTKRKSQTLTESCSKEKKLPKPDS